MPLREIEPKPSRQRIGPQWVLMVLVLVVMILTSVAFAHPGGQVSSSLTPASTVSVTPDSGETEFGSDALETTAGSQPPTPEEIGYTDGIIFCSSVLVLILLVATLRETLLKKDEKGDNDE